MCRRDSKQHIAGGIAKLGQTRRTQDFISIFRAKQALCEIPSLRGTWVQIPLPPLLLIEFRICHRPR